MTHQETSQILSILKAAYPDFYKGLSKNDAYGIINLWQRQFKDEPAEIVIAAVESLIATRTVRFPPVIGEVKEELQKLRQPKRMTEQEAWAIASKAAETCDLSYPQATFYELPPDIQRAIGSPAILRSWALSEAKTFQTVIASNFMRSWRTIQQREWEMAKLPGDVKAMIEGMKQPELLPGEYEPPTEGEFNSLRNRAVAMLEKMTNGEGAG